MHRTSGSGALVGGKKMTFTSRRISPTNSTYVPDSTEESNTISRESNSLPFSWYLSRVKSTSLPQRIIPAAPPPLRTYPGEEFTDIFYHGRNNTRLHSLSRRASERGRRDEADEAPSEVDGADGDDEAIFLLEIGQRSIDYHLYRLHLGNISLTSMSCAIINPTRTKFSVFIGLLLLGLSIEVVSPFSTIAPSFVPILVVASSRAARTAPPSEGRRGRRGHASVRSPSDPSDDDDGGGGVRRSTPPPPPAAGGDSSPRASSPRRRPSAPHRRRPLRIR